MSRIHVLLMHVDRPVKLARCIHCLLESHDDVRIILLQQGPPSKLARMVLEKLESMGHLVFYSRENIGIGPGREFLKKKALEDGCEYAFYLDDDIYVNKRAIRLGLKALEEYDVTGFPQLSPNGKLVSPGGYNIMVRNGVLVRRWPISELCRGRKYVPVNAVNAGCMLCKAVVLEKMFFGPYKSGFDDLQKSLSILGVFRQCITIAPVVHDREVRRTVYARVRYSGSIFKRAYREFISINKVRLELKDHLYYLNPAFKTLLDLARTVKSLITS